MALAQKDTWAALVKHIRDNVDGLADVRPYPLHRVRDAEFLKDIPDLQVPACLVVLRGRDRIDRKRVCKWSAILIASDPAGQAWEQAADLLDSLEEATAGQKICDGELWIRGDVSVMVADSDPRMAVIEMSFETEDEAA